MCERGATLANKPDESLPNNRSPVLEIRVLRLKILKAMQDASSYENEMCKLDKHRSPLLNWVCTQVGPKHFFVESWLIHIKSVSTHGKKEAGKHALQLYPRYTINTSTYTQVGYAPTDEYIR